MSLSPFKQEIDDLIHDFVEGNSTTLADVKKLWLSRKFTCIYDAMAASKLGLFLQSIYSHAIGYLVSAASLSQRLGEVKELKILVVSAKEKGIKGVTTLLNIMLEKNMFLFDYVEGYVTEIVSQLIELQNARVEEANKKLFRDTRIERFLHMDMGKEVDLNALKTMSTEYAEAKKQAVEEAGKEVDVENIEYIANGKEAIGDVVRNIVGNWNVHKMAFYQQNGSNQNAAQEQEGQHQQGEEQNKEDDYEFDDFGHEL